MYIDEAPVNEWLLIIEFWVKISVNSLKSVTIRPFTCGLSIFIIFLQTFSIYGGISLLKLAWNTKMSEISRDTNQRNKKIYNYRKEAEKG